MQSISNPSQSGKSQTGAWPHGVPPDDEQNMRNRQELLRKVIAELVNGTAAVAGIVFLRKDNLRWLRAADANMQLVGMQSNPEALQKNAQLLGKTMEQGETLTVTVDHELSASRPSAHATLICPLRTEQQIFGILQLFCPEEITEAELRAVKSKVELALTEVEYAWSEQAQSAPSVASPRFWQDFEPFTIALHAGLDVKRIGAIGANDGKLLMDVDRVSIAVRKGSRIKFIAVSGQDSVNNRSKILRQLKPITRVVAKSGEVFIHDGSQRTLPPNIEQDLSLFLQEANTRVLAAFPLMARRTDSTDPKQQEDIRKNRTRVIGVMLAERFASGRWEPEREQVARLVADHLGASLADAMQHERLFLLPAWRLLGKLFGWMRHRAIRVSTVLLLLAAFVTAMVVVPYEYRVEAVGEMIPRERREVFAPWDGKVDEVAVTAGQRVTKDQPLVVLVNEEVASELASVTGRYDETEKLLIAQREEYASAMRQGDKEESIRLEGRVVETQIELKALEQQKQILEERAASLIIKAPIDGIVTTFQLERLLDDRPVSRGDVLMEVMDTTGAWHLEMSVDDKRMGYVLAARQRSEEPLPVEYVLATKPEQSYFSELTEIGTRTDLHDELGNAVSVCASLDPTHIQHQHVGARVKAKISTGQQSLGYVLFGDAIDFIRLRLWL